MTKSGTIVWTVSVEIDFDRLTDSELKAFRSTEEERFLQAIRQTAHADATECVVEEKLLA